jgi:hypothetical protein
MARKKLIDSILEENELQEKELSAKVNELKEVKPLYEKYKDKNEDLVKNIKVLLDKLNLLEYNVEDFGVKVSISNSYYFDEEKLMKWLEANGHDDCIKTVKTVDGNALEKAVYNGLIPNEELKKFQLVKTTQRLLVK